MMRFSELRVSLYERGWVGCYVHLGAGCNMCVPLFHFHLQERPATFSLQRKVSRFNNSFSTQILLKGSVFKVKREKSKSYIISQQQPQMFYCWCTITLFSIIFSLHYRLLMGSCHDKMGKEEKRSKEADTIHINTRQLQAAICAFESYHCHFQEGVFLSVPCEDMKEYINSEKQAKSWTHLINLEVKFNGKITQLSTVKNCLLPSFTHCYNY